MKFETGICYLLVGLTNQIPYLSAKPYENRLVMRGSRRNKVPWMLERLGYSFVFYNYKLI